MGILKRIFRVGQHTIERGLDKVESNIYNLELELRKIEKVKNKIDESLVELTGLKNKTINDKNETDKLVKLLESSIGKAMEDKREDLAKKAFEMMNQNKNKIDVLNKTIESYDETISKVKKESDIILSKFTKMSAKIQELKIKDQFSKNINTLNNTINDINKITGNLCEKSDDVNKIEEQFYIAEAKLELLDSENELETLLEESSDIEFENYLKTIDVK